MMIDWKKIDTVLLDMDGTLLDLNFDNHFERRFLLASSAVGTAFPPFLTLASVAIFSLNKSFNFVMSNLGFFNILTFLMTTLFKG